MKLVSRAKYSFALAVGSLQSFLLLYYIGGYTSYHIPQNLIIALMWLEGIFTVILFVGVIVSKIIELKMERGKK